MTASARVLRRAARPNAVGLAGVALLGLAAGLAVVSASLGTRRAEQEPEASAAVAPQTDDGAPVAEVEGSERSSEAADVAVPAAVDATDGDAADTAGDTVEAAAEHTTGAAAPPPTASAAGTPGALPGAAAANAPNAPSADAPGSGTPTARPPAEPGLRLVRGRLAYIRCASGREPCPRDRALETAVWGALSTLSVCPGATQGSSDLRLLMSPGAPPEVSFRAAPDGPPIDDGALRECLGPSLSAVRTSLSEARYVVSFRFRLAR